ncbi:MAG: hypothetical protein ACRDOL_22585 [Streptosporangiaceae bacterium]
MADLTPAEWFDQFPPGRPGAEWPEDAPWCPRHWAPCPLLGANGIGAHLELTKIWVDELRPKGSYSAAAMNRHLAKASPLCCTLGDDRMYEIWAHWPPAQPAGEGPDA